MADLEDIAPPEVTAEIVDIRGKELKVRGLRNREWAMLFKRFPVLRRQAKGEPVSEEERADTALESQPAIIACGLGRPGDAKAEALIVDRLDDAEMRRVFDVIMRLGQPDPWAAGPEPREAAAAADQATG
jgi:hypothetical protein